eukprot:2178565-Amphidinium_carterae.3
MRWQVRLSISIWFEVFDDTRAHQTTTAYFCSVSLNMSCAYAESSKADSGQKYEEACVESQRFLEGHAPIGAHSSNTCQ